jgi:hypothetical protein
LFVFFFLIIFIRKLSFDELECEYWRTIERNNRQLTVNYGNDLDTSKTGSGFEQVQFDEIDKNIILSPDDNAYANGIGWNLNALPRLRGSLLGLIDENIAGIIAPW